MYCKFSNTKDYVDETSIVQRNDVLGLEFSGLMLLLLRSFSLKPYWSILDPRSQQAGSYKIGAVIVNV